MTRKEEYLQKAERPITKAQSQMIRLLSMAGLDYIEIARFVRCARIQVAVVKANMSRGR